MDFHFLLNVIDVRNDPKLFDFGLATEFRPDEVSKRAFKLTGDTGTIRYMAPEGGFQLSNALFDFDFTPNHLISFFLTFP